jgi:hypothetical protein
MVDDWMRTHIGERQYEEEEYLHHDKSNKSERDITGK